MSYLNGKSVLPENLLLEIQEFVDGEYIYIPRKEFNRKPWGSAGKSKQYIFERNEEIFKKYISGISAEILAEEYFLSVKTIYGILSKMKR